MRAKWCTAVARDAQTLPASRPRLMDGVGESDAVMGEEIFGPILPVLTFETFDQVAQPASKAKRNRWRAYLFSSDTGTHRPLHARTAIRRRLHQRRRHSPGNERDRRSAAWEKAVWAAYHGKRGFEAFSHVKSIVDKKTWLDLPMRYQPYSSAFYEKLLHDVPAIASRAQTLRASRIFRARPAYAFWDFLCLCHVLARRLAIRRLRLPLPQRR